jgi:shikimate kinase
MNIVLIGYRCAGKTTVGSRLASHLRRRFVDTDTVIEERHGTIRDIVELHGWPHFRVLEKGVIEEISGQDNLIIAPGGGFVLDTDNVAALKKNGLLIWLKANSQAVYLRMMKDPRTGAQRPSLTGKGTLQELEETMASRIPLYARAAEIHFDTSAREVPEVIEGVLFLLNGRAGRR